jgi:outer membrane protein OmpA-like peptidoglycan-associated protein
VRRRLAAVLLLGMPLLLAACAAPPPRVAAPTPAPAALPPPPAPAPKTLLVLLPDAEGKVGRVTLSNEGGSRTLDQGGTATGAADARTAPTEPAPMSAAEISAVFGDALAAQPAPPLHFVLYFEQGSTELIPESRLAVPAVVTAVRERASVDTSVVGHSDTAGDAAKNLELSLRRAMAVAALLVAEGIAPGSLDITSHGEANLLVPTADNVAEPKNRRVEVTVR